MSRGFRNSDETRDLEEQATSDTINAILERDREQAAHAAEVRARGQSGVCEDCGQPIGAERLKAIPTATRCVRCQAEWEQTNRF
jgi:DnaK suppressor protein